MYFVKINLTRVYISFRWKTSEIATKYETVETCKNLRPKVNSNKATTLLMIYELLPFST